MVRSGNFCGSVSWLKEPLRSLQLLTPLPDTILGSFAIGNIPFGTYRKVIVFCMYFMVNKIRVLMRPKSGLALGVLI